MKTAKKFLATALSLALIFSMLVVPASFSANASMPVQTATFVEDFNSYTNETQTFPNWETSGLANFRRCMTGTTCAHPDDLDAQIFTQLTSNAFDFSMYTDYTVSADVTLGVLGEIRSGVSTTGISARNSSLKGGAFEFQLYVPEEQTAGYVRLYDRSAGSAFATNTDVTYTMGTTVNMKIDVNGNLVKCYLDNELVMTYTDEKNVFATGPAGMRLMSKNILQVVDNFTVEGHKTLPNKFCDDFSSYTQETNSLKATAFRKAGWWLNNNAASGVINDGKITIPANYSDTHVTFLTSDAKGALAWNDYSVETDVSIGSGTLNTDVYAGVSGRHNDTTGITPYGYEISIYETKAGETGVRIFKRAAKTATLATAAYTVERDTVYNLKAVFKGNKISVYVNDTFVTSATDDTYKIGYAGIHCIAKNAGVVTTVDNFVVYDLELPSVLPNFEENFDAHAAYATNHPASKDLLISDGWASDVSLNNTFAGHSDTGAWVVPAADANIAKHCLRNTKASYKNHKIECDVIFDVTATKAQDNVVAILGGTTDNSGNGGYGIKFYITLDNKIRQIEIRNKSSNKLNPVVAGEGDKTIFEPTSAAARPSVTGVVVHITLEFKDTLLTATIDYGTATQVLNYTMPAPVNGCPALCTDVTNLTAGGVTYDNIKVYDTDNPNVPKVEVVGDANGDGTLDEADLTALRAYILGANGAAEITCDANYDGETSTLTDLIRIERILASL